MTPQEKLEALRLIGKMPKDEYKHPPLKQAFLDSLNGKVKEVR